MGIFDLYSKRQKQLRGEVPDVYTYDNISQPLRVQIVHIWQDVLGNADQYRNPVLYRESEVFHAYRMIVETLCREYGVFTLNNDNDYGNRNYLLELFNFILREQDRDKVLDSIELSFRVVHAITRNYNYLMREDASQRADSAIEELNARFQEHAIGFQFIDGKIIRIDSELIHSEVVKPALLLLHDKEYAGAQSEFLKAHEHYRHGNVKEVLNECLKSLESTMKSICVKRKWQHQSNATCSNLIQICLENNLVDTFWSSHFSALRSVLESGVPTARNKLSGHGQGATPITVPMHIAAYALHMTAACIVFLVESEKVLP
jgi:hypothetical protein